MLPPTWIMVLFHFRVGLSLCNPEMDIMRVRGPLETIASIHMPTPYKGPD